jgi:hypothetical protein
MKVSEQFQAVFAALKAILKRYELGKSYVSYHLVPVYGCPDLVEKLSERLRARMQGKACFNFQAAEPALFEELTRLTERGFRAFKKAGYA